MEPDLRARIAALGLGAMWLLGLAAALQILMFFFGTTSLATAVVGALIVDLGAGRAQISWSPDTASASIIATRVAWAVGLGASPALLAVGLGCAFGWAKIHSGRLDITFGLTVAGTFALAIRDELLLRAIPIHFMRRAALPTYLIVGFPALLSVAPTLAESPSVGAIALAISSGALFATLYAAPILKAQWGAGPWGAVSAHIAWAFVMGPLSHGGLVDLEWIHGDLAEGPKASGAPAFVAAALALATTAAVWFKVRNVPRAPIPSDRVHRG